MLLSLLYTFDAFSLKRIGLGDFTVFCMFGPLLMTECMLVLQPDLALGTDTLIYSVPVGLLTVGILHSNNVRDIEVDMAAGVFTIAQSLGVEGGAFVYILLLVVAYSFPLYFALQMQRWRCLYPLACLPWGIYLCKCIRKGTQTPKAWIMQEMPQRTAQHNLLWCTLYCMSFATDAMNVRLLLGCLFYLGGEFYTVAVRRLIRTL